MIRHSKILLGSLATLTALAMLPLTGCGGLDCGENTTERDGECVLSEELIQCEDGEVIKDGECVAEIECGQNTVRDGDSCVADAPIECGEGSELDAEENRCYVTDAVCGGNTAFASEEDRCVPTSEVCSEGSYFDEDTRLCLAEAQCSGEQVILNGYCVTSAEALAEDADVHAEGNTNPAFDGTPVDLPAKTGGEQSIFTGTIGEPTDLDGDEELDQVIDYFRFEGQAGDVFEISVRSTGIPNPAFHVYSEEAEEHFLHRYSPIGTSRDKMRQVILPEDGSYLIAVLPEAVLSNDEFLIGGDHWSYVGTLEQLDAPDAVAHEFTEGNVSGMIGPIDGNFVHVDEYEPGETVQLTWQHAPRTAEQVVTAWASPTEFIGEYFGSSASIEIPESGELYFVFDWEMMWGTTGLNYEVSGQGLVDLEAGETYSTTLTSDGNEVLEITQINAGNNAIAVTVTDSADEVVLEGDLVFTGSERVLRIHGTDADEYTVTFENESSSTIEDFIGNAHLITPEEITDFTETYYGEGFESNWTPQNYYLIYPDETSLYELTVDNTMGANDGGVRIFIYDDGEEVEKTSEAWGSTLVRSTIFEFMADTPYIVRLGNDWGFGDSNAYEYELTFQEVLTLADGESVTEDVTLEVNEILETWHQNGDNEALDVIITNDADEVIYDDSLSSGSIVQEIGLDAGDYTITFTNNSGESIVGYHTVANALPLIEGTTFTTEANDPVQISQSNDDSTSVTVVVTNPSDEIVHHDTLTTFGTLELVIADAGEHSISYFQSGEGPDDQVAEEIEFTVEIGVTVIIDTIMAAEGDIIELTQSNPNGTSVTVGIWNDADEEVVSQSLGSGGGTNFMRFIGLEAGEHDISFSFFGDLEADDFDEDITVISPTVIDDFDETYAGSSFEPNVFEQSFYFVEFGENTTYEMLLEHDGGSGWGRIFVYGLGDDQLYRMSSHVSGFSSTNTATFEFEANTPYIIRVGNDAGGTSNWPFDYFLSFTLQ